MFTNAEKILLRKYDVNYLRSNKEELVENFTIKNLDTIVEEEKKHGNTKSFILAPYNSYASFIESFSGDDIKIQNGLCKFCGKVKQANIKYELNNNEDFDNGVIITQNESMNDNNDNPGKEGLGKSNSNNNSFSKPISPNVELNDEVNVISGLSSPIGKGKIEINFDFSQPLVLKENIIREIEANIGYDYNYLVSCLKKREVNYATATYYLLTRDFNDNIAG